jgi:oligopeptidase A
VKNPLLEPKGLPVFNSIQASHVNDAVQRTLEKMRSKLVKAETSTTPSFQTAEEMERIQDSIHQVWGPISHLNSVISTPELREAYNKCLPMISEFGTELAQSEKLWAMFSQLEKDTDPSYTAKRQLISHTLRDFKLAGVGLPIESKNKFKELVKTLAQYQASFEQNLMDATDAFKHHETVKAALVGIPYMMLSRAKELAEKEGKIGWLFTLDPPTYQAIMAHAENENLRSLYYKAWVTRASDQGPQAGRWDNRVLIEKIVRLRHESALLLGFSNYAEFSLATKMANSTKEVLKFLQELAEKSRPVAQTELDELEAFAERRLNPWDISYFSEKLRQSRFGLSDNELRPYFPLPTVIAGLFVVAEKLFGIKINSQNNVETWHPDVIYYEIFSGKGSPIGGFFADLFTRPNKRGGAWMDECLVRCELEGLSQRPVAYLVCNFNPPSNSDPALLTHDDVVTLFHEFGHALHHLLTEVDYPSISGINGVPWDAVELPSQFLENYAWAPEVLPLISGHYLTGKALPAETLTTLNASRSFQAGLAMIRQIEFALFDFKLHAEYDPTQGSLTEEILENIRNEVTVMKVPTFNRFPNTFSHVFGGSYAAGYYSYKWAEVLAADAFSAFKDSGIFDEETARRFRSCILATGGSREALDNFQDFRGRLPSLDPLLIQDGILTKETINS